MGYPGVTSKVLGSVPYYAVLQDGCCCYWAGQLGHVQLGIVTNIGSNPTWDSWVFSVLWLPWRKVHLAFQEHTHMRTRTMV